MCALNSGVSGLLSPQKKKKNLPESQNANETTLLMPPKYTTQAEITRRALWRRAQRSKASNRSKVRKDHQPAVSAFKIFHKLTS